MIHDLELAAEELQTLQDELREQSGQMSLMRDRMEKERSRWQELFQGLPDACFITDRLGKIIEANPAASRLLGVRGEHLAGRPIAQFFPGDDRETARLQMLQLHQLHRPTEWRGRLEPKPGAAHLWVQVRISAVADPEGRMSGMRWLLREIAPQLELEAKACRLERELEESREMQRTLQTEMERRTIATNRWLAVLSHELRGSLSPAVMLLSARLAQGELPADLEEDLSIVMSAMDQQAHLVDDILEFSRGIAGRINLQTQAVDLHTLIETERHAIARTAAEKGVAIELQLAAEKSFVEGDSPRLLQVLRNLLQNALKFTPAGGRIEIQTHTEGDDLFLKIADSGIGIEPTKLNRIFEPFEQADSKILRQYGGLGLGLAIVRAIIIAHGGQVAAHSDGPAKGTEIVLQLPTIAKPEISLTPASASPAGPPSPLRILLVEDHAATQFALARLLRHEGHTVVCAASMGEALAASNREEPFDLLLSDIQLPDGSGRDLLQRLGSAAPRAAVAMSGLARRQDMDQSFAHGFQEHLVKPITFAQLEAVIHEVATSR